MEYRILGPLEVIADRPVDLGGRTQRTLLAVLLANAGRLVTLRYLIDAVWDDDPPSTAKRQVQNYVSALRRGLAAAGAPESVIETVESGYRLRPAPRELDATVFTDRVAEGLRHANDGRREAAVEQLRSALRMWRGPALFGLGGRVVEAAAAALDEQRLAAVEHRIELELALGRPQHLVAELTELVAAHPDRERLIGHLMIALTATGRQPEALALYSRHRTTVAEELGVDPGAHLRQIHADILRGDTAPGAVTPAARPAPAQLPPDVPGFTGRLEQLKTLDDLLPDPDRLPAAVVISAIAGLPGVGKTALAVHWGHRVRLHFPDGQLYVNLRGHATGPPLSAREALIHLLRSCGVTPDETTADTELAAARYRSLLSQRRVLVVLDNAATADQVRPLLPAGPGSMVLVTSRTRLTGLIARDGARQITVDVLDPDEALQLLSEILGPNRVAAEPEAAADLARSCSYLPLALRIAAANATHQPDTSLTDLVQTIRGTEPLAALDIPDDEQSSVRRTFELSYGVLPAQTRRLFRRFGIVAALDLTAPAAAALAQTTPQDAADALDRLAAAHVMYPIAADRYTAHDLLLHFAAERARDEESTADLAAAVGRLADWYLRCADAAAVLLYPNRLRLPVPPPQAIQAVPFQDSAGALAWLDDERPNLVVMIEQAAEQGLRSTAWLLADTIRPYFWLRVHTADWAHTAAIALAAARADGDRRAETAALLSLGDTADRQNRREEAIAHYTGARALAEETGWVDALTAALGKLGSLLLDSGRLRESADHYRQALTHNADGGSPHAQAVVLGSLGSIHFQLGELDEASAFYTRTLNLFRDMGSRQGEAAALDALGQVRHAQGRLGEAADLLTTALAIEREIGDRGTEANSLRTLAAVHRDNGQIGRAMELAKAMMTLAEDLDDRRLEAEANHILGTVRERAGRYWEAIDHHNHALALARLTGYRYNEVQALLGVAAAHAGLGDHAMAADQADTARAIAEEFGFARLAERAQAILAVLVQDSD